MFESYLKTSVIMIPRLTHAKTLTPRKYIRSNTVFKKLSWINEHKRDSKFTRFSTIPAQNSRVSPTSETLISEVKVWLYVNYQKNASSIETNKNAFLLTFKILIYSAVLCTFFILPILIKFSPSILINF